MQGCSRVGSSRGSGRVGSGGFRVTRSDPAGGIFENLLTRSGLTRERFEP